MNGKRVARKAGMSKFDMFMHAVVGVMAFGFILSHSGLGAAIVTIPVYVLAVVVVRRVI